MTYSTADLFVINQLNLMNGCYLCFQDGQIDYPEFVAMMQGNGGNNIGLGRPTMETSLNVTLRDAAQVH